MTDFHSHILPCVDDGSKSKEESFAMLHSLAEQGVDTVVATPHFYANSTDISSFLATRAAAMAQLDGLDGAAVKLLLGAELRYYEGVSRLENIESLCIQNSGLLLLEMPACRWPTSTVNELLFMAGQGKYRVVLAHIERYFSLQSKSVWQKLKENGVLFQMNTAHFASIITRRGALKLAKNGFLHFLGTDCHNMSTRPPIMAAACKCISKKMGDDFLAELIAFGNSFFCQ